MRTALGPSSLPFLGYLTANRLSPFAASRIFLASEWESAPLDLGGLRSVAAVAANVASDPNSGFPILFLVVSLTKLGLILGLQAPLATCCRMPS